MSNLSIIKQHYGTEPPQMHAVFSKIDNSMILPGYKDPDEAIEACNGLRVFFGDEFYVAIQK